MFHEDSVYIYTCILSWLCPFLYLKISLTSVTNGMGHTALTFIINITGIIIRLACVFLLIPKLGITGYLYGVLISNICMSLLYIFNIYKKLNIQPDPFGSIIVPLCIAVISIFSSRIICRIVFGLIIKKQKNTLSCLPVPPYAALYILFSLFMNNRNSVLYRRCRFPIVKSGFVLLPYPFHGSKTTIFCQFKYLCRLIFFLNST